MAKDLLLAALEQIRANHTLLAARATITANPDLLRDESPVVRVVRSLIVFPESDDDVVYLVRLASSLSLPIVPRGARTGLVGGGVPCETSVVVDLSRMTAVEAMDLPGRYLRVGAGMTLGRIEELLAEHGMMYPPDPASYRRATIGGTVATNAGGLRCVKYGTTGRWTRTLRVILADGTIVELGHPVIKDATGYDLTRLFVGSEGTLGIIVSVGIAFCPMPVDSRMLLAAFSTVAEALEATLTVLDTLVPSMCELLDHGAVSSRDTEALIPMLGDYRGWGPDPALLMLQVDGSDAEKECNRLLGALTGQVHSVQVVDAGDVDSVLDMRRGGSAVRTETDAGAATEESLVAPVEAIPSLPQDLSVPIARLAEVVLRVREIADCFALESRVAAHAGDGNLHLLLLANDAADRQSAFVSLREAMALVVDCVLNVGGTVSGEHGIGSAKRAWARQDLGPEVTEIHSSIKRAIDPKNLMNPRKGF